MAPASRVVARTIFRAWPCLCLLLSPLAAMAQPAPAITQHPQSQSAVVGTNASFTVTATGQTPLSYYWSHNGTNLSDGSRISGATTDTVSISNLLAADAGNYQVIVSNKHSVAVSDLASLTILFPPAFTTNPVSQSVLVNSNVIFTAAATGTTPLLYRWQRNGTNLENDGRIGGADTTTLSISALQTNDAGSYRLMASNSVGWAASVPAVLTILTPPIITQHPVGLVRKMGATAAFSVTASSPPSLSLSYQWRREGIPIGGATNASLVLSNVQPGQGGNYSVEVANNDGAVVSSNALLVVNGPAAGVPFISTLQPRIAAPGTNVTLMGTNFSGVATENIVYFGAVRAQVVSATATSIVAVVPAGATHAPITVMVDDLTASSDAPFLPAFLGDGSSISTATFGPRLDLGTPSGPHHTVLADFDGDGRPDLAFPNLYAHSISIYQNLASGGVLTAESFAPRFELPAATGADTPYGLTAADVDGDGRLDLLTSDRTENRVAVYRNLSDGGALSPASFAAPVTFAVGIDPRYVRAADLDGDGRPELVVPCVGSNVVAILRNMASPGALTSNSFAPVFLLPDGHSPIDAAIVDLDGDGKLDLAVVHINQSTLSIFRNTSVPGVIDAGSFAARVEFATHVATDTIAAGDVDGDGVVDLVTGSLASQGFSVFRNLATPGSFTTGSLAARVDFNSTGWVHTVALSDLNGDSKPDVGTVGEMNSFFGVQQNLAVPGNLNFGSFAPRVSFPTGQNAWGLSFGDLDGDGRPEAVFCNAYSDIVSIYQNQTLPGGSPSVVSHPSNATVTEADSVQFSAAAVGTLPLSYQWLHNGTNVPGATGTLLTIPNVQPVHAGDYSLRVTNVLGSTISSNALLTVLPPPPCATPASNIVSWWSGNGTTLDFVGGNNGALIGHATYGAGRSGLGFVFDGNSDAVVVGNQPTLQVQDFTIEAWVKRTSPTKATLAGGQTTGLFFGYGQNGYGFGLFDDGRLFLTKIGVSNVTLPSGITDTNWHHVAVVKRGVGFNPNVIFFIDGVPHPVAGVYEPDFAFPGNLAIGARGDTFGNAFWGAIDEVSFYSRPLSDGEIYDVYAAERSGKCSVPVPPFIVTQPQITGVIAGGNAAINVIAGGSVPLAYQWYRGTDAIVDGGRFSGATSNVLGIASAEVADEGFYSLLVTNVGGSVTSAPIQFVVAEPPEITVQPTNQTLVGGSNAIFVAAASGTEPLGYRWFRSGTGLNDDLYYSGAATPTLTISNVQSFHAGNYMLVVTNFAGVAASTAAVATVVLPPSILAHPSGRSVPLGLPVSFSAAGGGTPPLGYQWLLNGTNIPGATGLTYSIPAVAAEHLGGYQMVVTNFVGAITSSVAPLTIGPVATWGGDSRFGPAAIAPAGLSNVVALAAGNSFSMALRSDGTLTAWGTSSITNIPPGLSNIVGIAAGSAHAMALRSDGIVTAWGSSPSGFYLVPLWLSNVVAISAGGGHSAALRSDETVVVWGTSSQTNVPANLVGVAAVEAGAVHTLSLRKDGTVDSWGVGSTPQPPDGLGPVIAVSAGYQISLALRSNGTVAVWQNAFQGGFPPTNLPPGLNEVIAIDAGGVDQGAAHALALRANGRVVAWGSNFVGQTNVPAGLSNVVAISAGGTHSLALVNDGRPLITRPPAGGDVFRGRSLTLKATILGTAPIDYQWLHNGTNVPGATNTTLSFDSCEFSHAGAYQLTASNAFGFAISVPAPVTVVEGAPFFRLHPGLVNRPNIGSRFTLGASVGGSGPMSFQWEQNGQDIPGATNESLVINRVHLTNMGTYRLHAENSHGGIFSAPVSLTPVSVVTWGHNPNIPSLTNPPPDLTNAIAIAGNFNSSLALRANGQVVAWGGISAQTNIPPGLSNVVEIAAGNNFHMVLDRDAKVTAWGSGLNGGFLAALNTLSNVVAIEAEYFHADFLMADGSVRRLLSSGTFSSFPSLTNVVDIAVADDGIAALRANGTVEFQNFTGALPLPPPASNVLAMGIQRYNGTFLRRDGSLQTWGMFPPLPPTNLVDMIAVSGNAAVRTDGTVTPWPAGFTTAAITNMPRRLTSVAAIDSGGSHVVALLVARDFPPVFLPNAVDTPALVLSSKNSPQWFGQTNVTHDGSDAAQSAEIGSNTSSSMRTWLAGPITIRFWWKVSSEAGNDRLSFSAGGVTLTNISGEIGWQQCTVALPPGNQIVAWTYSKDGEGTAGQDAGWVDQLELIPHAPLITAQPLGQHALYGDDVVISATASGTPPLAYRWRRNTVPIPGPVGSAPDLSLGNVTRSNSGLYSLVVTNVAGVAVSSNALLSVHVPQQLAIPVLQPGGAVRLSSTDFDGGGLSTGDLAYLTAQVSSNLLEWTPLPGALSITNGVLYLNDPGATNHPLRFYRVVESW